MKLYASRRKSGYRALIATVAVFAVVAVCFVALLNRTDRRVTEEQLTLLKDALYSASISCYASEGRYPASLEYLREHYNIFIDDALYDVSYDIFASNIMPDIEVRAKEGA